MKKLISLILTLALCLTAFAAFAETPSKEAIAALAVPAPAVADNAAVIIDNADEAAKEDSVNLLNALVEGLTNVTFEETYKKLEGLEDAVSIMCTPLPKITVDLSAVTDANKDDIVTIKSDIPASAAAYLNTYGDKLGAVFTYLKGTELFSVVIKVTVTDNAIEYGIPLGVLADASGCPSFINFVI